jgi:tetratricopeptide (TPR) repeat protein
LGAAGMVAASWLYALPSAASESPDANPQEQTTTVSPENKAQANHYFETGKEHHLAQRYREAITEYEKALALYPDWQRARQALAWANRDLRRQQSEQNPLEYTLENLVNDAQDHYQRGRSLERENKVIEAAAAYKDALRLIPGYPEAKEALKRVQAKGQKTLAPLPASAAAVSSQTPRAYQPPEFKSLGEDSRAAARAEAPDAVAEASAAKAARMPDLQPQPRKASLAAKQPVDNSKQQVRTAIQNHYLAGNQALDRGDYEIAVKEFELVLEFMPDHREAQYKINVAKKNQATAIRTAKRQVEMAQTKGDMVEILGALRNVLNIDPKDEEALAAWERTKRENPGLLEELYRKGVNAYAKGNYQMAQQSWELVLDIDPKHAKAKESLEKVREKLELIK